MVLIASYTTGRIADRAEQTRDADILVDICTRPTMLATVVNDLRAFGFEAIEPFGGTDFARCTFANPSGQGQIDVLCPEDASAEDLRSVDGVQSLAIPGGRRALALSEQVLITYDIESPDVMVRVPLLPGAIVVKAAASVDERTLHQDRHIQDVVDLLSLLEDPVDARTALDLGDLELLSSLRPRLEDDGDVAWERFGEQARLEARAAFEILIRT